MTDADALARFEALVHAQRLPDTPWQPVTDYSNAARDILEGPHADRIWQHLVPYGGTLLDYGCGVGEHLIRNLRRSASRPGLGVVYGYDPQIPTSDRHLRHARRGYDLVICREVLEHLTVRGIAETVRTLCSLSRRYVYVTTRFAKAPDHLLAVDTSDDLDPTHITMLTQDFLRVLFVLEGFRRRADLEQAMDWKGYGRVLVYERA